MQRRHFLGQLLTGAAACASFPGWAAAGAPEFITAGNLADKSTWLVGLKLDGTVCFKIPLPGRGHAAAAHPTRAEAIGFARRPGRFAVVLDCVTGAEISRLTSPKGRHFYGHGAYSTDGTRLFTTENNYDELTGVIGIYDPNDGYARIGEVPSGGIGPHEILRHPAGGYVVANGGIQTHPDMARAKLNIPTMEPSLAYLDDSGAIVDQVFLPDEMHLNSIRHISIAPDGAVLIATQWQGNPLAKVPLVARHHRGEEITFLPHPDEVKLKNYAGSIACDMADGSFAVTGPKGSVLLRFDASGAPLGSQSLGTASGVACAPGGGLVVTCDGGLLHKTSLAERFIAVDGGWAWDNHLVAL